jgi:hypothetical protein
MKPILGLAAALVLLANTPAFAQQGAQGGVPAAAGVQRGLQSMHNSGQNGYVTLFARGMSTRVVVDVHGMAPAPDQVVAIQRGKVCSAIESGNVARSADLVGGWSRGTVPMSEQRLMSGNYLVIVKGSAANGERVVSCGHLST